MNKKGQISIEYLVLVSFIAFLVVTVLGVALVYSAQMRDQIRFYQLEQFSSKIIASAESVYYAGEPSRSTITAYLPGGLNDVVISGFDMTFSISTNS